MTLAETGMSGADVVKLVSAVIGGLGVFVGACAVAWVKMIRPLLNKNPGKTIVLRAVLQEVPELYEHRLKTVEEQSQRTAEELASLGKETRDAIGGLREEVRNLDTHTQRKLDWLINKLGASPATPPN